MARSPAEDQRGFVASEQGASQSAGRGRRACDGFRRENWLRGAGPGEPGGGRAEGRGSSCSPGSPRVRGVYYPCTRSAKEQGSQAGLSHPRGRVTGCPGKSARKERGKEAHLDGQPGRPCRSLSAQPLPPPSPAPAWVLGGAKNLTCLWAPSLPAAPPCACPLPGAPRTCLSHLVLPPTGP